MSRFITKIEDYIVRDDGVIVSPHQNEIQQTVKGYTIGYWINGKFRSLAWVLENKKRIRKLKE